MIVAILVLTVFNTGLIILIGLGGLSATQELIRASHKGMTKHIDESIESATTALFNKESIKQKVEMSGKFEL